MDKLEQIAKAIEALEAITAAVDAGELEASTSMLAGLVGGIAALKVLQNTTV